MLRQLRIEFGLQRKFVANKLDVTPDHLNKIERGKCSLTTENAEKLSKIYNKTIDEIFRIHKGDKVDARLGNRRTRKSS